MQMTIVSKVWGNGFRPYIYFDADKRTGAWGQHTFSTHELCELHIRHCVEMICKGLHATI